MSLRAFFSAPASASSSGLFSLSSPLLWKHWNQSPAKCGGAQYRKKPVKGGNGAPWRFVRVGEQLHRVHNYKVAFKRFYPDARPDMSDWHKKHGEVQAMQKAARLGKMSSNPEERVLMRHEIAERLPPELR